MTVTVLVLRRAPAPAAAHLVFLVPLAIDVWLTATGSRWPTPRATGWRRSVGPVPRFVDLSAPIVPSPPERRTRCGPSSSTPATPRAPLRSRRCSGSRPSSSATARAGRSRTFLRLGTHSTTHVDAPWHYNSTIGGAPARRSTSCRSSGSSQPGVVLDFTAKADGDAVTAAEVEAALRRVGHELAPLHIVLVRTGRDRFLDDPGYLARGSGVTAEATRWLHDRGVRVMGIDAWGWDAPLHLQAQAALERRAARGLLGRAPGRPAVLRSSSGCATSARCPPTGFTVALLPAARDRRQRRPRRVVGIVED